MNQASNPNAQRVDCWLARCIWLGCAIGLHAGAADLARQIDVWNVESGLPNNTVTAIAQTRDGFLWVGTDNGLARFDGRQFRVFSPQNTPALASARIRALCGDDSGRLWIATADPQLACFAVGNFEVVGPAKITNASAIISLTASGDKIWYADVGGIIGRISDHKIIPMTTNASASNGGLRLFCGETGAVYAAGGLGLAKIWPEKVEQLLGGSAVKLQFATPGRAGRWLDSGSSLISWRGANKLVAVNFPTNVLRQTKVALEDREGCLWLGTESAGVWCRQDDGSILSFSTTNGLGSDSILCLFADARGAIWVGTEGGGLSRIQRKPFQAVPPAADLHEASASTVVEGRPGEIWVGTERNGLNKVIAVQPETASVVPISPLRRIRTLNFDSRQRLWIGTQDEGLFVLDNQRAEPCFALPGVQRVSALFEDDSWGLWVGAGVSNAVFRLVGDAPQQFSLPFLLPTLDVRGFADDGAGGLWIATQGNGLFHRDGHDWNRLTRDNGLGSDTVWSLLWDTGENSLWIGTAGGGLSRIKNGILKTCMAQQGLFDDTVCQILDDGKGWLWCSSPRGIFRVSKHDLADYFDDRRDSIHCAAYGLADGLPSLECAGGSQPAGCRSRDGRLWWPTSKGLVWVDPGQIRTNAEPPAVFFNELLVDDHSIRISSAPSGIGGATPAAVVAPGIHQIELRFTALSWEAPEYIRFRHRLNGFDAAWSSPEKERAVRYHGLAPKAYRFEISAMNRDGVWSEPGAAIRFQIKPFFWQTLWFRAAAAVTGAVCIAVIVAWVVRFRHRVRLSKLQQLHAVEQERARIAQDIHDDLGASLTQIALLSELAQKQIEQPQAARGHLDQIFTSAQRLARATDEIVWALHPKNNSVEMSLNFIARFTQEYLRTAKVRCRLDIPTELPEANLPSATRHHLFLAVKEALNNVVKHAGATEVWLRLVCEPDKLLLTIEDNGKGFDTAQRVTPRKDARRGNGLHSMDSRMRAVGGIFEQSSQIGKGTATRFVLLLKE